jgi:hypothetical protein
VIAVVEELLEEERHLFSITFTTTLANPSTEKMKRVKELKNKRRMKKEGGERERRLSLQD